MENDKVKDLGLFSSVMRLRAGSVIVVFLGLMIFAYFKIFIYSTLYLFSLFILSLALNFGYKHIYKILHRVEYLIYFYLCIDTVYITIILFLTGGVMSFLFPLYFLAIVVTSFMSSRAISYFSSTIAGVSYGVLFFLEYFYEFQPSGDFPVISPEKKILIFAVNIVLLIIFGVFSDSIASALRKKSMELYKSNLKLQEVQKELEDNMKKLSLEKERMEATYKDIEEGSKVLMKTDMELTKANKLLDEKLKGMVTLQEIGTLLSSAKTLQGILKAINESIVDKLQYNKSLMVLMRTLESAFFIHRGVGFSLKNLNKFEKVIQDGVLPYSILKARPFIVNNQAEIPKESMPYVKALDVKHFIEVPLKVKGEVVGTIIAGKDELYTEKIEEKDCELLSILAAQAAAAIENARSTEAIIEAKNQIEAIINSIIDGMVVTDSNGSVILVNPAFERIFKVSVDEVKGKKFENIVDNNTLLELINTEIPFDKDSISEEIELASLLERAPRILKASISRVMNEKGEVLGKVTLFRDITYEKEIDRMKSEFISTVSHELRTPLTSIKSFAEILLTYEEDKETQKEFLTIINDESERLTRLINDVLNISKIESGRVEWKLEDVHMEELIISAVNATSSLIHNKDLKLELRIDDNLPAIEVDKDKIIQVITNLLSNSIKFTPEHGEIILHAYNDQGNIFVTVKDNGPGIAPENHEKIFLKFCQIEDQVAGKPDGTGLGLAICREIIKYHRGKIWVESDLGKGCLFIFTVPVKSASMEGPDADGSKDGVRGTASGTKLIKLSKAMRKGNGRNGE